MPKLCHFTSLIVVLASAEATWIPSSALAFSHSAAPCALLVSSSRLVQSSGTACLQMGSPKAESATLASASKNGRKPSVFDFLRSPKGTYRYVRPNAQETISSVPSGVLATNPAPDDLMLDPSKKPKLSATATFLNLPRGTQLGLARETGYRPSYIARGTHRVYEGEGIVSPGGDTTHQSINDLSNVGSEQLATSLLLELMHNGTVLHEYDTASSKPTLDWSPVINMFARLKLFDKCPQHSAPESLTAVSRLEEEDLVVETIQDEPDEGPVQRDGFVLEHPSALSNNALSSDTQKYSGPPGRPRVPMVLVALRMSQMILAVGIRDLTISTASAVGIKLFEMAALGQDFSEATIPLELVALMVIAFRTFEDGIVFPSISLAHLEPKVSQTMSKPVEAVEAARSLSVEVAMKMSGVVGSALNMDADEGGSALPRSSKRRVTLYQKVAATLAVLMTSAQASAEQLFDLFLD